MPCDLNCDMGEVEGLLRDGTQRELLRYVSSVNICCNAHAGSEDLIVRTLEMSRGAKVGAHPGYPDRAGFGRRHLEMSHEELVDCILGQLEWLGERAKRVGIERVTHVKAHGALYNGAVMVREIAAAISEACWKWDRSVKLVGLAGSGMLDVFREFGFEVLAEGFADRAYEPDGTLRARALPGAMIEDPEMAAEQAVGLASTVDTICVHSDTRDSVRIAAAVRAGLDGMSRMKL
jgi:5-oxoprolinase (ATP-hydrolysing) subunit A